MYGSGGDGPPSGRIYVGSLPNMYTEKDVEREFERFGKIIKMDFKRTISGSGYCFLEYADPRDARDAIAQLHGRPPPGMRDAPPLRVEVPLSSRGGGGEAGRGLPRGLTTRRGRFILDIRGLPPTGSWQDLKDHFRRIGDVGYAEVWKDAESCDGCNVGEVSFFTRRDMVEAIEVLDGSTFRSHEGEKTRITVREKRIVGERDRDRGDRDRGDRGRPAGENMGGRSEDEDYEYGGRDRGGGGGMRGSSRGGDGRKYNGGASNGGGGGYYGGGGGYHHHHHPDYNGGSNRRGGDGYHDYYHNTGGGGSQSPPRRSGDSNMGGGRYYGGASGGGGYYEGGGTRGAARGRSRSRERGGRQGPGGERNYGGGSGRGADGGCYEAPYGDTMGNSSPSMRRAAPPGGRCMVEEPVAAGGGRAKYERESGVRERRLS